MRSRLAAVLMCALGLGLCASGGAASAQSTAKPDPLELFSAMMPVFSSDRCMNCHGVVDPETGTEHAGGSVPGFKRPPFGAGSSQTCFACHTEGVTTEVVQVPAQPGFEPAHTETETRGQWVLAPREMSFVGKSPGALCHQVQQMTRDGSAEAVLEHFAEDERIQMAFEGMRGIDDTSPEWPVEAEPPPMTKSAFMQAASRWVNEGGMHCGAGWYGSITYTFTHTFSREEPLDGGGTHTITEHQEDTSTVQVDDGVGTTVTRSITTLKTETIHRNVQGQCTPGAKLTSGTDDISIEDRQEGTATADSPTVRIGPVRLGTYSVSFTSPIPTLTVAHTDRVIHKLCGAGAQYSGLLPGSGPDFDTVHTSTSQIDGSPQADATTFGGTGEVDTDDPDALDGDFVLPISTNQDRYETTWHLRN